MPKVRNIVFDCNESILDLTTITPVFQRLFGAPAAMRLWFRELITYSQALTIADVYVPFTDIGGAVLEKIAAPTRALGASPSDMCMVACHTWDTIGAQAAGWEAGLIQRVNNDVLDTAAQPQYVGKDLNAIADQIIARHGPGRE
jgi:hypothetical protein